MICYRLHIRGRVQGVSFRDWMVEEARRAGVSGWVRNRDDGSVEALVAGGEAAVSSLVTRCRNGPPLASVDDINQQSETPPPDLSGFTRR